HGARSHAGSVRGKGAGRARGLPDSLDDGTVRGLRPDRVRAPRPPAPGRRHGAGGVRRGAHLPRVAQRVSVRLVVQHGREATVPSARLRRRGRADGLPRARPLRDPAPQDDRPARGVPQRLNVRSHRLPFNEVDMRAFALPIACSVLGALLVAAGLRPPTRFVPKLQEPAVPGDPTSGQQSEQLPTYNAYSADGDVTGPLVYVNYGVPADYEQLERLGVSVKGAIVIARYGGSWRGIKPKVAAEHGAVGCLIYSDPRDDGYRQGDVYPQGPWRPRGGVPRGSVADT